jgi:hypothetical protein
MALEIRKAQRRKAKLRLALLGPTGSGKTMSALKLAFGIGGKVGVIDTENGSADLYAHLGEYDVITLGKPYTVQKYREAIDAFEQAGYDTIIVDSLTHAWAGDGGLLAKQGQVEKRVGNSFAAWREITPDHNALVEAMLSSPCHVIGTMRVKTEYVLEENDRGKKVPRKVGLQPVQRDGMEYEFTVVMDVDADHKASASKDRTTLFAGWYDTISEETGRKLRDWLETGAAPLPSTLPILAPDASLKQVPTGAWLAAVRKAVGLMESAEALRAWHEAMAPHMKTVAAVNAAWAAEAEGEIATRAEQLEQKEAA